MLGTIIKKRITKLILHIWRLSDKINYVHFSVRLPGCLSTSLPSIVYARRRLSADRDVIGCVATINAIWGNRRNARIVANNVCMKNNNYARVMQHRLVGLLRRLGRVRSFHI